MHDNPPQGQPFQQDFPVHAYATRHVDVVLKQDPVGQPPSSHIIIYHVVQGVTQFIASGSYQVTLLAEGRDTAPDRMRFLIDVDPQGGLLFQAA